MALLEGAGDQQNWYRIRVDSFGRGDVSSRHFEPFRTFAFVEFPNLGIREAGIRQGGTRVELDGFLKERHGLIGVIVVALEQLHALDVERIGGPGDRLDGHSGAQFKCAGDRGEYGRDTFTEFLLEPLRRGMILYPLYLSFGNPNLKIP